MCGIAGEIRFTGHGPGGPDVEAVARITAGHGAARPGRLGLWHAAGRSRWAPPAEDHRPVRARRAADGRRRPRA